MSCKLSVYTLFVSTGASIHDKDLHVKLCTKNLSDETIFWQTVFFSVELSVSAIAKNHKNRVLTLLRDRDVSDDFDVFDFSKLQNAKSIGKISTPQKCQNHIFVIFGCRGNTQLHAKKDRLSKDCLIAEIFSTQLYMQIHHERYSKSKDFASKCVYLEIGGAEHPIRSGIQKSAIFFGKFQI